MTKIRFEARDEIILRNQNLRALSQDGVPIKNLNRTVGGSFLNTLDVSTVNLPGNFGARAIEQITSSTLTDIYIERKTIHAGLVCLEEFYQLPP